MKIRLNNYFGNIDALLVTNPDNIFYLSGILLQNPSEREAYIIISPKKSIFITDTRLTLEVKNKLNPTKYTLVERSAEKTLPSILNDYLKKNKAKHLGIEKDSLTLGEFEYLKAKVINCKLIPLANTIEDLRLLKTQRELAKIRDAASITDKVFLEVKKYIKMGVNETEIVWKIKEFTAFLGAQPAFEPIVAFGKSSSTPHYTAKNTPLTRGCNILLDFGARYQGYCSDLTRVLFTNNSPTCLINMYAYANKANLLAQEYINKQLAQKQKVTARAVDAVARNYLLEQKYPSIPHSVGHGVGIAIHEKPRLSIKSSDHLTNGMVFTLEPGIYLPHLGGVRFEELCAINNNKLEILSHTPSHPITLAI